MASAGSVSSSFLKPKGDNIDMGWQWNSLKDLGNRKNVICDFCGNSTSGGITRAKKHQLGIRDVNACTKTPPEVKALLKEAFDKKKGERDSYANELEDRDEDEELQLISDIRNGKRTPIESSTTTPSSSSRKDKGKAVMIEESDDEEISDEEDGVIYQLSSGESEKSDDEDVLEDEE